MKMKTLAVAAVLALSAASASAVNVFNLGDITASGALFASPGYASAANIDDTWIFSLTGSNNFAAQIARNFSTANGSINGFAATISGGSLVGSHALTLGSTDTSQELTYGALLGTGSYSLKVTGLSQRVNTRYTFNLDVTPVPEPETYGMLLAGMGVLAFVARRRKPV
ncbi:FxDxF family PEP-CTERM protein [Rugamonas sp. CCM 8940]|uniref:FxDxF family PEP-CTERM protein n=1 Tax=Rugamonas sp. CCM 8940 TaxID=2765359 RepID=UPI0018F7A262|nr:FxDxF family PEP-CTERM protein [Rugamonas sp. CCM 8940]MBJ7313809.1 PEP-CTERM sorting domain-containing protein [Rugamonas sp. CCM 8940]